MDSYTLDFRLENVESQDPIGPITKCVVCQLLLHKPVSLECNKRRHYCVSCVEHATSCPNCDKSPHIRDPYPWLFELMDDVEVYCLKRNVGCPWTGKRMEFEKHYKKECMFFSCDNREHGCLWVGKVDDIQPHLEKCDFVQVKCEFGCGKSLWRYESTSHESECKVVIAKKEEAERREKEELRAKLEKEEEERRNQLKKLEEQKMEDISKTAEQVMKSINPERVVKLDVGGRLFSTSEETLLDKRSSPFFSKLFSERQDSESAIFLDRDPELFALLLKYLRNGSSLPTYLSPQSVHELIMEALFWNVNSLLNELLVFLKPRKTALDIYGMELYGRDYSKLDLSYLHFVNCDLTNSKLDGCDLQATRFTDCNLEGCSFESSKFTKYLVKCNMLRVNLSSVDLTKTQINESNFSDATVTNTVFPQNLTGCNFTGVAFMGNLANRNFTNSILNHANFLDATIDSSNFKGAKVSGCRFPKLLSKVILAGVDLSSLDLSECRFDACDFTGCKLQNTILPPSLAGCNFSKTNFMGKNLKKTHLDGANFTSCNFHGAKLPEEMTNVNFTKVKMRQQDFSGKSLAQCTFTGAKVNGSKFSKCKLLQCTLPSAMEKCDFTGADLYSWTEAMNHSLEAISMKGSIFCSSNLKGVKLPKDLSECTFSNTDWSDISFANNIMKQANFSGCELKSQQLPKDLVSCIFERTVFQGDFGGYDFSGCDLSGADFTKANVSGAKFDGVIIFKTVFPEDLSKCSFNEVDFSTRDLSKHKITQSSFVSAKLSQATLPTILTGCNFSKIEDFSRDLSLFDLSSVSFAQTNLKGAKFPKTLNKCDFSGAENLSVDFSHHDVIECNFSEAKIVNSKFPTSLNHCNFSKTSFNTVTFDGAVNIIFSGAKFLHVKFPKVLEECTFTGNDLSNINIGSTTFVKCKFSKTLFPTVPNCVLKESELNEVDFSKANLSKSTFQSCTLVSVLLPADIATTFIQSTLERCDLRKLSQQTNLINCVFEKCDFSGCKPPNCEQITFSNCDLSNSDLSSFEFGKLRLLGQNTVLNCKLPVVPEVAENVCLERCNLSGSDLSKWKLSKGAIKDSKLQNCKLPSVCHNVDFSGSDLSGSDLAGCNFTGAKLAGCTLNGCNLSTTNLSGCDLSGIDLSKSTVSNLSLFSGGDIVSSDQHKMAIYGWVPTYSWELIYKATRDGDTAQQFHAKCDNQGPTLVIIKTNANYIFGGYTNSHWNQSGNYATDPKDFLFTLVNPHNVAPTKFNCNPKGKNSHYNHSSYGPTFGGGHDIQVSNSFFSSGDSYISFPSSYVDTSGKGGNIFCNSGSFVCTEVEVFKAKTIGKIQTCNFSKANLTSSKLPNILIGCDFSGANLSNVTLGEVYNCTFDGTIVDKPNILGGSILTAQHKNLLNSWFPQKYLWKLLYQASRDGDAAQKFHQMCDNKGPLLVVIKSNCGRTFGGYAHASWQSNGSYATNPESFLFALNCSYATNQKFPSTNNGSYCTQYFQGSYGPYFGSNGELVIANNCLSQNSSSKFQGYSFQNPTGQTYPFTSGSSFLCAEVEVYCAN